MSNKSILLIPHGNFEVDFLEILATAVSNEYHIKVTIGESHFDINEYYDPMRRQYDANSLLKEIDSINTNLYEKKIGLFRVDLFIPILTYIFGQASLKGEAGIASLYRLRNEHYGMKKDEKILSERFIKVVIHELGHTYGLLHCHIPSCVMRSSTYVEDIDQKSQKLCIKCRNEIGLV